MSISFLSYRPSRLNLVLILNQVTKIVLWVFKVQKFSSLVLIDFSIVKQNEYFENICGGGNMTWQLRAMPAIAARWKFDS